MAQEAPGLDLTLSVHGVDTAAASEERKKLRRSVGRLDTAFLMLAAIIVLDTLGAVSSYGAQTFTWLIVMVIFFLLPYGLLTAELGSTFPEEGGPYVWVKLAFGRAAAAVVSVMYWVDNPIWLAGTLAITAMATFSRETVQRQRLPGRVGDRLRRLWGPTASSGAVLTGAGKVLADIAAIGVIFGLLSSGVVWLIGSDRTQAVAGFDGAAPRWMGHFSKRLGTPIAVNLLSGVVSTGILILALTLTSGNSAKYFSAALGLVISMVTITYVLIFPAVIRLRYRYRPPRTPAILAAPLPRRRQAPAIRWTRRTCRTWRVHVGKFGF